MENARPATSRYVFLDYLRAAAAWLVAWDHLAVILPGDLGRVFGPATAIREHVAAPLGVTQDFGWFGVALFFLISGFIISDRARVESLREFVIRRLLRIYPALAVAAALAAIFLAAREDVTLKNVFLAVTLLNYLLVPQVILLGVAWTLVIEMLFYALTAATQFARNSPHRIALNLALVALVLWKARALGPNFFLFAATAAYLPVLVMGQTIYWWLAARRLSTPWALAYLLAAHLVFLAGLRSIHTAFLAPTNSYPISVAYALLLFLALVNANLPERRVVRFLSDTSYSLYLLHGVVGWGVLVALKSAPLGAAIPLAAAASLAAAYVSFRFVERPFQGLGRRLTRSRPRAVEGEPLTRAA